MPIEDYETELDPKIVLRFGMSEKERKELEAKIKRKRKKLAKGWRPLDH